MEFLIFQKKTKIKIKIFEKKARVIGSFLMIIDMDLKEQAIKRSLKKQSQSIRSRLISIFRSQTHSNPIKLERNFKKRFEEIWEEILPNQYHTRFQYSFDLFFTFKFTLQSNQTVKID